MIGIRKLEAVSKTQLRFPKQRNICLKRAENVKNCYEPGKGSNEPDKACHELTKFLIKRTRYM